MAARLREAEQGRIAGAINVNTGSVSPGVAGIGTLNATSLTWNGGAVFKFDLNDAGSTSDNLNLTGAFTKGTGSGSVFDFQNREARPPTRW